MFKTVKLSSLGVLISALALILCVLVIKSGASVLSAATAGTGAAGGVKVPVLMYHSLLKNPKVPNRYTISPELFEQDLKYLKENGFNTVNVQDLTDFVCEGKELPDKPILLSFDDGHYNNIYYGVPLLEKYGMKAVMFIVGEFTDRSTEEGDVNPNYSYLNWEQVKELSDSGVFEIQNHSYDMHRNNGSRCGIQKRKSEEVSEYEKKLAGDLQKLQDKVYECTGKYPAAFAYPFGALCKESYPVVESIFKVSMVSQEGVSVICRGDKSCLYGVKRIVRPPGISTQSFFSSKVGEFMD